MVSKNKVNTLNTTQKQLHTKETHAQVHTQPHASVHKTHTDTQTHMHRAQDTHACAHTQHIYHKEHTLKVRETQVKLISIWSIQ